MREELGTLSELTDMRGFSALRGDGLGGETAKTLERLTADARAEHRSMTDQFKAGERKVNAQSDKLDQQAKELREVKTELSKK